MDDVPLIALPFDPADEPLVSQGDLSIVGKDVGVPPPPPPHAEPRPLPSPKEPTSAEREKHALTHLPYQTWCPHGVAGKRSNSPHRRVRNHSDKPMLSADYGFYSANGDGKGTLACFLAVYLRPLGVYYAFVVDSKGPSPSSIRLLSNFIQDCGLINFLYRSDREHAVVSLLKDAIREAGRVGLPSSLQQFLDGPFVSDVDPEEDAVAGPHDRPPSAGNPSPGIGPVIAVSEHSHTGESQSNGAAERAVKMVEDQTRTLKSALEEHIGWEIPVDHPLFGWILHHAAFLLTKFHVGNDGLTG